MRSLILLIAVLATSLHMQGQDGQKKKIELIRANDLRFDESLGAGAQRLIGNVKFRHVGAVMRCDSAYLYEKSNSLEAWGNVKVEQGDTLFLYGDSLDYSGNRRYAEVRGNIRMLDRDLTLTTEYLDYDLAKNTGLYYDGGKIISKENDNVLVSKKGYYYADDNTFFFKDSVRLTHPDYTVRTDTLRYHTVSEVAYFLGPTRIISDENTIYCENGWYDTKNDLAQFNENAEIRSKPYILNGDSLFYDRNKGFGEAFENVQLVDTSSSYLLSGDYGRYLEPTGKAYVTGHALMVQYNKGDSLFMHADTLKAVEDSLRGNKLLAYYGVRIFKEDLQGKCDSLSYNETDSLLTMYSEPILWSDQNQISGDTITLTLHEGEMKQMYVRRTAFIISEADTNKYNQIKGREMIGHFRDNEMYKMDVLGNGQSIYYAQDEKKKDEFLGVNKAECSNITIYVEDSEINRIAFYTEPSATFFPLSEFPDDQRELQDFKWKAAFRPRSKSDLFKY